MKPDVERRVAAELRKGASILKVARKLGVGHGMVQRIAAEMLNVRVKRA